MADAHATPDLLDLERRLRAAHGQLHHPPTPDLAGWWTRQHAQGAPLSTAFAVPADTRAARSTPSDVGSSAAWPPVRRIRRWPREAGQLAAALLAFALLAALLALVLRPGGEPAVAPGVAPSGSPTATEGPPPAKQTVEQQALDQQATAEAGPHAPKPTPGGSLTASCPPEEPLGIFAPRIGVGAPVTPFRDWEAHTDIGARASNGTLYAIRTGNVASNRAVGVISVRRLIDICAEPGSTGEPFQFYSAPEPHGALTAYAVDGDDVWFFAADGTLGRFNFVSGTFLPAADARVTPVPASTATPVAGTTPTAAPELGLACDLRYDAPSVAPDISQKAAIVAARASFPAGSVGATWPDNEISAIYGHVVNGAAPDTDALLWIIAFNGLDGATNQAATPFADVQTLVLIDAQSSFVRDVCTAGRDAALIPTVSLAPPFTDPRELAAYYFQQLAGANWVALQPLLADEYQAFSYGEGHPRDHYSAVIRAGGPLPLDTQPGQWDVEEHDGSTLIVARLRDPQLPLALVMQRTPDGTLRLDPGPCALQLAAYWRERPDGLADATQEPPYQLERHVDGDDGTLQFQVSRRFQNMADCVSYADGAVMVTSTLTFWKDVGSLALDGLYWTVGDQRGPVRVVWTDAVTDGAMLRFPTPRMPYTVTLLLDGAPSDTELHLHIEGLTIHDAAGADIVFGYDDTLSGQPYPNPNAPLAPTPEPTATIDRTN